MPLKSIAHTVGDASANNISMALVEFRMRHELTLQDVADRTGVSIGTLSKLENRRGTPNFRTLTRIIQMLELHDPPPEAAPAAGRKTVTKVDDTLSAVSDRAIMSVHAAELLNKSMFPMVAEITLREVPPIAEWAEHAGEEFIYVLTGEIEVLMEHYQPFVLRAGESTYYDSGMRHVVISLGAENATVISVSTSEETIRQS